MEGTWNARLFSLACGAALAAGSVVAVRSAYAASLTVPANQFVTVELSETLTSATAHVGDTFGFVTTRDEMLGSLAVPKGTPGHGRLAVVRVAQDKDPGVIALQADSIDLPDGDTVWVNIDTNNPPRGRLADKHTRLLLPFPILQSSATGNMILDRGVTFNVYTIPPRPSPAPLLTATPSPPTPVPAPTTPPPPPSFPPAPVPESTAPPAMPVPSTPSPTPTPTPTATPET